MLRLSRLNVLKTRIDVDVFYKKWSIRKLSSKSGKKFDFSTIPQKNIRNFAVIAHIDHGKTTISNKLLELAGQRLEESILDSLQVERERGITVKAHTCSMLYPYKGETYLLNLIDTPGHVDFHTEVRRALRACQGVVLVVDAAQGVQAQTLANWRLAQEANLPVVPVLNKVDLPAALPDAVRSQLERLCHVSPDECLEVSAKSGKGIVDIFEALIERVPPPSGEPQQPLRSLLFDSWFDRFRGVICMMEVVDGRLQKGDKIVSAHSQREYEVTEVGVLLPAQHPLPELRTGQVGYCIPAMKSSAEALIGDTFFHRRSPVTALPGFQPPRPMVYSGIYPISNSELEKLRDAIQKLLLTDSSVSVQSEASDALGHGFRCGFLGLLHMEVFQQRLEHEFGIEVLVTAPTVPYKLKIQSKEGPKEITVSNPSHFPEKSSILRCLEPTVFATIVFPAEYIGTVITFCESRRGEQISLEYTDDTNVVVKYKLPLSEVITVFFDKLKEATSGYATFDYEDAGFAETSIVKLSILLNGSPVDPLSALVHGSRADYYAREITSKLKTLIERQMFPIAIQACVGAKVLARENIQALRKNVTAKCYGGDVTRKRKLLEKQKEGKKRMRKIGNVNLSQDAFLAILTS